MSIKKTKIAGNSKSKRLFKKRMNRSKTKKSNSKSKSKSNSNKKMNSKKFHSKNNSSLKKRKHKSNHSGKSNNNNHIGGFSSSNLVTVKEPGFNLDALGTAIGINIPSSRAAIYRSNSKTDTYQAMTP